ncbi:MAG TPA: metal-dependent phosphohydrolase [Cyanobacteria bacterium UBA11149]|nr:metal-dependent phosphohydrolase [Cyanobacteria bacterium UBA11367]HBE57186.1 metal-dependent phosphohydrolase [Cyanobacteria bacterium UBA11366]HBK64020.1 metal-dependent phosphohydrolase [Cyanobacteria bacterium UBA11166]HBR74156.1 metal-dependent phosphohydrolase [Cyanobacteria bacterium UBA11159]HBS71480.1 metal-dependent phosphohydrolase [Cyanobacteria bacterium UBA11153]HBW90921.1 metal-dependent phosphohydrolase [Cyanobacteria bacterium UBA11149]HCA93553.1 metal-dependent phosphohyd
MLQGSILQQLETRHRGGKRPLNFGVYYKHTLVALCHALEDFILESAGNPLMITAFQKGKWYLEEANRYGEIAKKAAQIVILATPEGGFAHHPTSQLANVALVPLAPSDPVAQEWHLIILSETYTAMVLCQELSAADYGISGIPENDRERKFYGFWTFEAELVRETVNLAIAHIGSYNQELQALLTKQVEEITANFGTRQRDNIGLVVSLVVDYLERFHQDLHQVGEDTINILPSHEQALDNNLISNEIQAFLRMAQLIDKADAINPMAAAEVASLSEAMGQLLDLPVWQIKRLRLAGLLHRLASFSGVEEFIDPLKSRIQEELVQQKDVIPKASVLRVMPQLQAIANIINHQSEYWDGTGKPDGLAYDAIPLESRILGLIATFQYQVSANKSAENFLFNGLVYCQARAGNIFDPKLVEALELLVIGMSQGMILPANQPKIAAGMWLLDSHEE